MPSWSATRRASWMSCPAQHAPFRPVAAPWSYSWSVTPITSWPASCRRPATVLLSTPPDMATTIRIGRAAGSIAPLSLEQVAAGGGQLHGQPVELLRHHELAAEPGGLLQPEGEVEHVLLVLGRLRELAEPSRVDDHMAG